jgi:hypothetical protein
MCRCARISDRPPNGLHAVITAAARIEARVPGVIVVRDLGRSYSSRGDKNNEHGKPRTAPGTCETYGISSEAVTVLSHAVESGNGTMPQFSHPELGGPGQWAPWRHDDDREFNDALKTKVKQLCSELARPLERAISANQVPLCQRRHTSGSLLHLCVCAATVRPAEGQSAPPSRARLRG